LARLELRGITSIDGEFIFSVFNPDTKESKWMIQGVPDGGIQIRSFDLEANSVVIHSESEDLSRELQMNDYAAPTAINLASTSSSANKQPQAVQPETPTGTLTRTQQAIKRPTRRNLQALRERRAQLAEKLRKQPRTGEADQKVGETQQ